MLTIINHWRELDLGAPPFVHAQDEVAIRRFASTAVQSITEFTRSDHFGKFDGTLQLGVWPMPYVGDIQRADIFIVLLNPGFELADLDKGSTAYELSLRRTIRQENLNEEPFPFMFLNPQFASSGGYRWWEAKLRDVVLTLAREGELQYFEALRRLSLRLAAIELFPYASTSRPGDFSKVPSTQLAQAFVRNVVAPRARNNDACLIVTRQVSTWGVTAKPEDENIVLYDRGHARGASLSSNSRGGQAILTRMRQPRLSGATADEDPF